MLTAKAHDLFAAYGAACTEGPPLTTEDQMCAVLGFTGSTLRGSVVVVASTAALDASNPLPETGGVAWVAELTNQLVGRFKNELLRHAIDVTMSIPVVLTATRIEPLSRVAFVPISLAVGAGGVMLWLEVEGEAQLLDVLPAEDALGSEGDMMMF